MARTREFDLDETLTKALKVFWERGYHGTKMRDVSAGTGVAHAGLYAAFKSKDALFYRVLRKYASEQTSYLFGPLEQPDAGIEEIRTFFERVVEGARSGSFSNGCFIANTSAEYHAKDAVSDLLGDTYSRQVSAFMNALANAQQAGDLKQGSDLGDLAATMVTLFYGMSALARRGAGAKELQRAAAPMVLLSG